jgi:hypothetical protein
MKNKYFDPFDWYWLRRDKLHAYSSKYGKEVSTSDQVYLDFISNNNIPTSFPLDDDYKSESKKYMLEVLKRYKLDHESLIQKRLDDFAKQKNYDNMSVLISYSNSNNEVFKREAFIGITARDTTWETYFNIIDNNPEIYYSDLEELLPLLSWE